MSSLTGGADRAYEEVARPPPRKKGKPGGKLARLRAAHDRQRDRRRAYDEEKLQELLEENTGGGGQSK